MKSETNEAEQLFPVSERAPEIAVKHRRIQDFLAEHALDSLLVSRHENIAWATAGIVEMRVAIPRETGAGSLLFTRGGATYYLTTNNEAPRFAQEEFAHLDYEPVIQPWYANDPPASVRKITGQGKAAGDDISSKLPFVPMNSLRLQLTESEIARYRWLGANVAESVTDALFALRPGMSESTMQAMVGERLLAKRILPSVFLTAVDGRIHKYRHAVPREGVLEHFGMLNLCGRRWGLAISITRYVYFGEVPVELEQKFDAVARVNAALLGATREGATAEGLFTVAQEAYAAEGYPGEEQLHHQGGATGYWEREWVARLGGKDQVLDREAMAWNPSLQGTKIEDTVVLREGEIEILTRTPRLPLVESSCNGRVYQSAGILRA